MYVCAVARSLEDVNFEKAHDHIIETEFFGTGDSRFQSCNCWYC